MEVRTVSWIMSRTVAVDVWGVPTPKTAYRYIRVFHDPNPTEVISLLGVANSMWGSAFPHPEGLRDPPAFSEDIASMPIEDQRAVMGGNLARLLGVG